MEAAFDYVARDGAGARRSGRIAAPSAAEARALLRADGLRPVSLWPSERAAGVRHAGGLALRDAAALCDRLARLGGRRVPLERALEVVAEGKGRAADAAARARAALREGQGAEEALCGPGGLSDPACRAILATAGMSGDIAGALDAAHRMLAGRLALRRKLLTGLLYPAVLFVVAAMSVGLILIAIIPQFRPLVEGRMDLVPVLGRAVFGLSLLFERTWPAMAGAFIAGIGLAGWAARAGHLRIFWDVVGTRVPVLARVLSAARRAQTLATLSALLEHKVLVVRALRLVADAAAGTPDHLPLDGAVRAVESGMPLWRALGEGGVLDGDALETVRIGEEAGDLPAMVRRAADDLRAAQDRATERFMLLFQPALIVAVGLLIGISLYALFSAITAVNAISF